MTSYVVSAKTGEGVALTFQKVRRGQAMCCIVCTPLLSYLGHPGLMLTTPVLLTSSYLYARQSCLTSVSQPFPCLPHNTCPSQSSLTHAAPRHPLLTHLPLVPQIAAELLGVRLSKAEQEQQQPVVTAEIVTFQETSLPKMPAAASPSTSTVCSVM